MITNLSELDLKKQYTYADYLTWQIKDRVELIKGFIYKMSPAPTPIHQIISGNLVTDINTFLRKSQCQVFSAPFDVRLKNKRKSSNDNEIISVVQPDVCIVCDKLKIDTRGCIGAPDMIIEILSKGNTKLELEEKFMLYQENEVKEYWIVQPGDETVTVFDLINNAYVLRKIYSNDSEIHVAVVPGLVLKMADIF
jgi:Uma2 family endonuclease